MDQFAIAPLPARYVRKAVALLADAFADDPIFRFHFADPGQRRKALFLLFGDIVRSHLRFGHVYGAFDRDTLVGAAVWRPPNAGSAGIGAMLSELMTRARILALSPRTGRMLLDGFARLQRMHPDAPHWYLFFIGVDADRRGSGIGERLMMPVLETADRVGTVCYLETPFPRTLRFYQKFGYRVIGEPKPFTGAPQLWAMSRKPRPDP